MKNALLAASAAILVLAIGIFLATSDSSDFPSFGFFEEDPILVVLVGEARHVDLVRGAIDPGRILVDTPDAFALAEERVIAVDADAASVPIEAAGWLDREIEIVAIPMDGGRQWDRRRRTGSKDLTEEEQKRAEKIAELLKKPTLNPIEATVLLQHMDRTGQF